MDLILHPDQINSFIDSYVWPFTWISDCFQHSKLTCVSLALKASSIKLGVIKKDKIVILNRLAEFRRSFGGAST